jgi:hypothetical protein
MIGAARYAAAAGVVEDSSESSEPHREKQKT